MVLYPKLQCSVSITVLSTERVNCILFEIFKWYLCCNQNMKVKRFSDFSCWATARGTCSTIIPHFITISESCLIMLYPNVYHCHDLETNATKEWHVRNIIPLLKVFTLLLIFKGASNKQKKHSIHYRSPFSLSQLT
ncbi:hypothetical protein Tsp_02649 [Trichinella spiralis]|uniref:hypothetical protein n=1 Tax=Trichinella spiralis TaxID=6334 RepID=UPI0001EFBDA3|nr:hypothetical protein Tsp_02649 [Trichinella spiralis]